MSHILRKHVLCILILFVILIIANLCYQLIIDYIFYFEFERINKKISEDINIYIICKYQFYSLICGRNKTKYKFPIINNKPHSSFLPISLINLCICNKKIECSNAFLLIGILTRPECIFERMIFRRILRNKDKIIYIFITGISITINSNNLLIKERDIYNDIIIFNVVASYYNCSLVMSCFYIYIFKYCSNIKWVMKLDIDTYLNIEKLLNILYKVDKNVSVIGAMNKNPKIKCNAKGKWNINCLNKNKTYIYFPSYPFGPGFLFRYSSVKCINEYYNSSEYIVWVEDILFGILMKYCKLKYYDISRYTDLTYRPKYNISVTKNYLLVHGLHPIEIILPYLENK